MSLTRLNSKMIEVPADIEGTLTVLSLNSTDFNTTNAIVTNLTADNVQFNVSNYEVNLITNDIEFSNNENSKAFHFDTDATSTINATFPDELTPGFNVSIFNTGNGTINLFASDLIRASGQSNSTPFTGMFIYKAPDGLLYGIGVFE